MDKDLRRQPMTKLDALADLEELMKKIENDPELNPIEKEEVWNWLGDEAYRRYWES